MAYIIQCYGILHIKQISFISRSRKVEMKFLAHYSKYICTLLFTNIFEMNHISKKLELDNNNYSIFICVVADRPINGFVERGFAYSTISSVHFVYTCNSIRIRFKWKHKWCFVITISCISCYFLVKCEFPIFESTLRTAPSWNVHKKKMTAKTWINHIFVGFLFEVLREFFNRLWVHTFWKSTWTKRKWKDQSLWLRTET